MPDGFSQNFIRAYALGSEAKTRKERLRLEEEQQAFQRQQAILQLQRIEEDRKIAAVGRGQQDVLSQLKLSEQAPHPTVALPEGQPGPPAPAEVTPLQFPTYGGKSIPVTPRFQEDVLAAERAQKDVAQQSELQGKLEATRQAEALPVPLGPAGRAAIGAPQTGELTDADVKAITKRYEESQANKRANISASRLGPSGLAITDPTTKAAVEKIADRIASGQITIADGRGLLGGVKGGLGPALMMALGDREVIPPAARRDIQAINVTRNLVDQMEAQMEAVIAAKTPEKRVKETLLLEGYGQATGTLLARGFGERGVVTDKDVNRATKLVPGWKAANFAPAFGRAEIKLLREVIDRNEKGISDTYLKEFSTGEPKRRRRVLDPATGAFREE